MPGNWPAFTGAGQISAAATAINTPPWTSQQSQVNNDQRVTRASACGTLFVLTRISGKVAR
ncbi:MAG: hypothetical protein ACTHMU_21805, partial [Thermomicrobiales bacterium]